MPDRIVQVSDGTVLSCDMVNGKPVHLKKWEDKDITFKSLTEEQIADFVAKLYNHQDRPVEKA